ncbi:hypothetical protein [Alcanivorax sp.]|uniref:hypothetical protein n=1 Tax=Alcanivorax sp. TaxID=1872427 RepID=UPI001992D29A|nr:hypothetical protein [Alcanivorax sp.]MBD3643543.1 hypothetical protein [Alcanivorax sp.]
MGIFSSGADSARKVRQLLYDQYQENKGRLQSAGGYAEDLLNPYMLDPSVMQELQGVVTGTGSNYQKSPIYQQYMDVGKETMLQDMAGTGTLYSGKRMEGMRDLGQSAFGQYMNTLTGLAGFGRDTASQLGGIRMNTAANIAGAGNQYASDVANIRMAQQANESSMGMGLLNAGASIGAAALMSPGSMGG